MATDTPASPTGNRSVSRAAHIIRAIASTPDPLTISEISRLVDLPRPTTFRILQTLEEEGFVDRKGTVYYIGWDLARMARTVDPSNGMAERARPILADLADRLGESVTLSIKEGPYDLNVILQEAPREAIISLIDHRSERNMTGQRWPHHASGTGKLLLAELTDSQIEILMSGKLDKVASQTITSMEVLMQEIREVREQGWAQTDNELEDGLYAVAAAIKDDLGYMVAAVALFAPQHRMDSTEIRKEKIEILQQGAQEIQQRIFSANNT